MAVSTNSSGEPLKSLPNVPAAMASTVSFTPRRIARNAFMRSAPLMNHVL